MTRNLRRAAVTALAGAALAGPASAHAAATYADGVLADAPLIYLRANDAPAATVAQDASVNARHGAYTGAPALGIAGPFSDAGTAVRLGAADAITATVTPASGSIELWVAPDRLARGQQAGIAAHGQPAGDGWALGIGEKRKLAWVSGGVAVTSKVSLSTGVWTQLTVTWTDKKVDIYRNGVLAKSINRNGAAPVSTGGALVLGGNGAGAFTGAFKGRLDEVSLYGDVLSAGKVQQHFTAAHVPINTALPTVTGTPAVGSTLTAHPGTWTGGGVPTYQWQRCDADGEDCEDITGATGTDYAVVAADACGTLQVAETMTSATGEGTAVSDPTGKVPGSCDPAKPDPGSTGGAGPVPPAGGSDPAPVSAPGAGIAPAAAAGCLKLLAGRRTAKLRRIGALRLKAAAGSCLTTPLRASFKARRGVLVRSVRYTLDGKRLKRVRQGARLRVAALTAGTHTLSLRVTPRHGRAQRVKLRLRVATG
jgi:hypothetical protein